MARLPKTVQTWRRRRSDRMFQQSQDFSRNSDNGNRSGISRFISAEKPKVVSTTTVSQGPSSRTRANK